MSDGNPETIGDVIYQCHFGVPVNVPVDLAIDAHMQARNHPCETVRYYALRTVILACGADLEADRKRLDYLASLSENAWAGFPDPVAGQRDVMAMMRRSIAWQMQA